MRYILSTCLIIALVGVVTPKQLDERDLSYGIGVKFYNQKDYLNAYKYLLMYKYSHYDILYKDENKNTLVSVDIALNYCETEINLTLSGVKGWHGHGFEEREVQQLQKNIDTPQPSLPENHP